MTTAPLPRARIRNIQVNIYPPFGSDALIFAFKGEKCKRKSDVFTNDNSTPSNGVLFFSSFFPSGGARGGARTREKVSKTPYRSIPIIIPSPPPFPSPSRETAELFFSKWSSKRFGFSSRSRRLSPPFTASMISFLGRSSRTLRRDALRRAQTRRTSLSDAHPS